MKMKSIIAIAITVFILLPSMASCGKKFKGNGTIVKHEVAITDYRGMDISGNATIYYEQKDTIPYLLVKVDENLIPYLKVDVDEDQILKLKFKKKRVKPTEFIIYTNSKELSSLDISGSCEFNTTTPIHTNKLDISVAGSGKINCDSINTETLNIDIAGSGKVTAKGVATNGKYDIAGSGKLNFLDLVSENVDCDIAGSGKLEVTANKTLNIDIAGSGKIKYRGNPTVKQSIAGSGSITKADSDETSHSVGVSL